MESRPFVPEGRNVIARGFNPWHQYLRDSGLVHTLLGLESREQILGHPKCGASWEGFALEQVIRRTGVTECYFWATHGGTELDLLLFVKGRRIGVEFKFADAPTTTRSMRTAIDLLRLDHLWVVYPGRRRYPLDEGIDAVPLAEIPVAAEELLGG